MEIMVVLYKAWADSHRFPDDVGTCTRYCEFCPWHLLLADLLNNSSCSSLTNAWVLSNEAHKIVRWLLFCSNCNQCWLNVVPLKWQKVPFFTIPKSCQWQGPGDPLPCYVSIEYDDVPDHFKMEHGIKAMKRSMKVRCCWHSCEQNISRHNFSRHIRETHLGYGRL